MQRPYFSRPTNGVIPVRPGLFKGVVNYFALAMAKQRTDSAKSSNGANLGFEQRRLKLIAGELRVNGSERIAGGYA
jgi:hypothetical protein